MVDQVARALCEAAGRSVYDDPEKESAACSCCEKLPNGSLRCLYWTAFRGEAKAAIVAAYLWNKKERRWPSFVRES